MRKGVLCLLAAICVGWMLPPSSAMAEGPGTYGNIEWINWKARRRDMDFVIVDPTADYVVEGQRTSLNYDRDSGVRLGLGYQTVRGWDLGVEYQTFYTNDHLAVDVPVGGELWGTRLHPNALIDDNNVTTAQATASLNYHVVDLSVGRRFILDESECVTFKLLGGFRYAILDQAFDVRYLQEPPGYTVDIGHLVKLDGYGLRIAGQLDWDVTAHLCVFGRVAGSVLAARVDSGYTEMDDPGTGATARVDISETYYQTVPVIETAAGVAYRHGCWEAALGYELANWANVGERLDFQDDVDPQKHSVSSTDILLDGFFLRIAYNR